MKAIEPFDATRQHGRLIVKVCGMRDPQNIRQLATTGIDWMGMIFWPRSPRYVDMVHTPAGFLPDQATDTAAEATRRLKRVGVFVDESPQAIITHIVNFSLDAIQLHGHETPTLIRNLRATVKPDIQPKLTVIKAISVSGKADLERCHDYEDCVDYFLFDTKCTTMGGSGVQFDWHVLDTYQGSKPFLLSGGIGPADADRVRSFHHPMLAGIDLNSRFETAPGMKDIKAIRLFVAAINK